MKNTMPLRVTLAICCLVLVVGSGSRLLAADRITSDVKITPQTTLTPNERKAISIAASRMLHHVDNARRDIERKNPKEALANAKQALTLVRIIDNAVPELQVNATIKSGDLTYTDTDRVKEVLVPIYKEEDEFVDATSSLGKSGKRTVLKRSSGRPTFGAGFEESETFFDVRQAKSLLERTIADLNKKDLHRADQTLGEIQDAIVLVHEEADLPLERAQMNLLEASRLAAADRFKEAEGFLNRTVGALEKYQEEVGGEAAAKARGLITSIRGVSGKLEQDKAGARKQLSGFVAELSGWL